MTSPAAAALRIEPKVAGVAVNDLAKLDGGAAQPGYVAAAMAGVSSAAKNARRRIGNFIAPPKKSNPTVSRFALSGEFVAIGRLNRRKNEALLTCLKGCLRSSWRDMLKNSLSIRAAP